MADWLRDNARRSDCFADLHVSVARERALKWRKGRFDEQGVSLSTQISLRAVDALGREASAAAAGVSPEPAVLEGLLEKAKRALPYAGANPYRPAPSWLDYLGEPKNEKSKLDIVDPDWDLKIGAWPALARHCLGLLARRKGLKEVLAMELAAGIEENVYAASNGIVRRETGSAGSLSVELVAEKKGEIRVFGGGASSRRWSDLRRKAPAVLEKTARLTLGLAGARQPPLGRFPVVIDPWLGEEMLELLAPSFSADRVHKGFSPWKNRLGETVAGSPVSLIDDGRLKGGLGSARWDDEGFATGRQVLIDAGRLCGFLYDFASARKDGARTTGNAVCAGDGTPSPGTSNFYLAAGKSSPQSLIEETRRGVYLIALQGLHTVDLAAGHFSLGGSGFWIEGGELAYGIDRFSVSGNMFDLLKSIDAVGSDLEFNGSMAAPTVRVAHLDIGA
ncbi:MAG: TldD/PmbA family protein [Elusimicrobia bacterium]|nr:TldD/PmbA family protein [Elusimicrobiota bacterium]